ncbi:hypothetical protein B2J88_11910 [Rhodococcus sp. SRB_17]|nr:beta family protein [Acidovorax sp. SRB_24]NMM75546.1 hypothetical protein [Acidovorax sp. SRB_24]NMM85065.1 hypothetical protein [Rhodococcus sp. SRB_17]
MAKLNLSTYTYFPALRTRLAELRGLKELDGARKARIVPMLTLGQWRGSSELNKAAEKAAEAAGDRPFFMDLSSDNRKVEVHWDQLRNSTDAFRAWRQFAAEYKNAIPVVQIPVGGRTRDIVQQAQEIESAFGTVAFRIQDFAAQTPFVISAISALDDPRNAIVFIDCQYIREAMAAFVTATISTVNALRSEFPALLIVVLSTSFPSSTLPFADSTKRRGVIPILERELHARVGGNPVAIYGDHGSVHAVVYDDVPMMRWSPRIDYPTYTDWHFERRPGPIEPGYIESARAIQEEFDCSTTSTIWGERMIAEAAAGSPYGKAPASWIAVRVNIHLSRQIDYEEASRQDNDNENGFDDDSL